MSAKPPKSTGRTDSQSTRWEFEIGKREVIHFANTSVSFQSGPAAKSPLEEYHGDATPPVKE